MDGIPVPIESLGEMDGRDFPAALVINQKIRGSRRVFIGHRFTPLVTQDLRHNLQTVLRPYGIATIYSDSDMPNDSVFDTILQAHTGAATAGIPID